MSDKNKGKGSSSENRINRVEHISPNAQKIGDTAKQNNGANRSQNGDGWDKIDKKGSGAGDRPKRG